MFSEILVDLLQEKGMSAYKLAKLTGISQGLMGEYKRGIKTPSATNLAKIADVLGVSTDVLLGKSAISDPPTPEEENAFAQLFSELTAEEQMEIVQRMLEMRNKK